MTRPATPDPRLRSAPRWALLFVLAVGAVAAGGYALDRWQTPPPPDLAAVRPGFGLASFSEASARAGRDVAEARAGLAVAPGEWSHAERLALALVARWRLTGDYADLAEAGRLLDEALAAIPDPGGPLLAEASFAVTVHRLDRADAALAQIARWAAPYPGEVADAAALAGDVALQRGELDAADAKYAAAVRIFPAPGIRLRRAVLAAHRGKRDAAAAQLEALIAEPRQPPWMLAALMLQRANLGYAAGEWTVAGRWVGAAQRVFPGYWLADAYAAQQFALAGRMEEAERAWRIVAERSGRPETMDALAHLLRLQGRADESRAWAARAAAKWAAIGARFPEAVAHHRAEHELAVGSAARALVFAQADAAARPQAPNLVLLARALLAAGRAREALGLLDRADAQGWVSANQLLARADVLAALGEAESSDAAREAAEALNPRAVDPRVRLIWFGHD